MITNIHDAHDALESMIEDLQADIGEDAGDDMIADLVASLTYQCDDDTAYEIARCELGFYPGSARPLAGGAPDPLDI